MRIARRGGPEPRHAARGWHKGNWSTNQGISRMPRFPTNNIQPPLRTAVAASLSPSPPPGNGLATQLRGDYALSYRFRDQKREAASVPSPRRSRFRFCTPPGTPLSSLMFFCRSRQGKASFGLRFLFFDVLNAFSMLQKIDQYFNFN